MKKAIKINLGGLIFHIDEDAYDKMKQYLSALINQFGNNAEAREIVTDIESRVAELFQAKLKDGKQVIVLADVEDVISIMGKPNEYDTNDLSEDDQDAGTGYYPSGSRRRFYRNTDNAVLGGVCSGLGAYFKIDANIIRIIFLVFLFIWGAALPIYIILWIALPAAQTAAQKLEMRGEEVNISNIEKKVKEEYEQVRKNFKRIDPNNKARNIFESIIHVITTILKGLFKTIAIILGVVFIIVGLALVVAFMAVLFGKPIMNGNNIHFGDINFLIGQFAGTGMHWLALTLMIIMCAIPVLAILYLGLKLIFKFKTKDNYFWVSAIVIWVVCIFAFVTLTVTMVKNVSEDSFKTSTFDIQTKNYKNIRLTSNSEQDLKELNVLMDNNDEAQYFLDEEKNILGRPKLTIEKSLDSTGHISIERKARGSSYTNANTNAQNIQYDIFQRDSSIIIDPYFMLKPDSKWRAQQIEITIYIPVGTNVTIDKNLHDVLKDANINGTFWIHELPGKTWIMSEKGLEQQHD